MAFNVLFVCTANTSLSIMSQALLNKLGRGQFQAYSAGVKAMGTVNPYALETLKQAGYDISGLKAKSWNEFAAPMAPRLDAVVTMTDEAQKARAPIWYSNPVIVHWSFIDPETVSGEDSERIAAFRRCFGQLEQQMLKLCAAKVDGLKDTALRNRLQSIAPEA
ncbi:MAG: arsenate reductase ArsC [Alphaproteobacteria bacterium]|nr:arsenate reductase ArsC [Alphaproteobacteria bacterium]MBF0251270.1 arsenate reductase ArsC [Alphaproteobacteria bacterium]